MATPTERELRPAVASVTRALALIDALAESKAGLGVNELARRIGVNASTASRLLATLERGRIVERAPGGLRARERSGAGKKHDWQILGASRGEGGILGEGVRQALLRDPTYGPALAAVRGFGPQ